MSIYEVHLGSWRLNPLEGNRPLTYLELADELSRLRQGHGLHAHRADAGDGAPVHGLLGLPGDGLLRADAALRLARRPARVRRPPAPERHRRDPRLGPGALPARRLRAGPLRRHGAVRARRPAPRRAPGLGHAGLQLRAPRGPQLPRLQRAVLARGVPRRRHPRGRRGLDALPRLLARGRRVGAERVRRQREPRRGRVPEGAQRGHPRARAGRDLCRRGIDGLAGRLAAHVPGRARASASNGTWAGCTTRWPTSRTTRSTAATTTTS